MLAVGGSASAIGQTITVNPGALNFDQNCIDPNLTNPFNAYSTNYISYSLQTPLWVGSGGVSGTVSYSNGPCAAFDAKPGGFAVNGRIGFANGYQGSIQDDFRLSNGDPSVNMDNGATFNYGMNANSFTAKTEASTLPFGTDAGGMIGAAPSGSNWSFADVTTGPAGNVAQHFFGSSIYEAFFGDSNRYFYIRDKGVSGVDSLLVMDVLGDASRCTWQLKNTSTTASQSIGMYFCQWAYISGGYAYSPGGNYEGIEGLDHSFGQGLVEPEPMAYITPPPGQELQDYISIPGQVPVQLQTRYTNTNPDPTLHVPAYVNFTGGLLGAAPTDPLGSPLTGPGYQVVNAPIPDVEDPNGESDQTPVDEFVVGDPVHLGNGVGTITGSPTINDFLFPDNSPGTPTTYVQKWYPALVGPGQTRTIVTYYRSIWGDSDYSNGYTAVVDTPKTFSVSRTNASQFNYPPNALTGNNVPYLPIQVDVDNTGAFGQVYKGVQMTNVKVTLQLGQGLYDANNPGNEVLTNFIPSIAPTQMASTTFEITADPTVNGTVPYTVTITPDVGVQKTITGFINLGATAQLLINQGPNLITSPWSVSNPTWQTVLGLNPETDFQAFVWDAARGEYVIQTGPQRGYGTWIVSNASHGFIPLGGNPQIPADEFPPATGLGTIQLQQGWNLIADPYNYSFPLGQLIGVAQGSSTVYNYDNLVLQGFFDGSFAYYDQSQQSYSFIQTDTARMVPNLGYWVFAQTPMTLQFPPIFDLFVRSAEMPAQFKQRFNNWRLQLSASQGRATDQANYAGMTTFGAANTRAVRKAPIPPVSGAIRAYLTYYGTANRGNGNGIKVPGGAQYAQLMSGRLGKQMYNFSVYTTKGGATTVRWPNLKSIPSNLAVTVRDASTGRSVNARTQTGASYYAQANGVHTYTVTVTPEGTERESIGSVSTPIRTIGPIKQMSIVFDATTRGSANISVYKGSQKVGTIITNTDIAPGQNVVKWSLLLSNGEVAPSGTYTLDIQATGEGGDTTSKLVSVRI